jgi:hypothetical protein
MIRQTTASDLSTSDQRVWLHPALTQDCVAKTYHTVWSPRAFVRNESKGFTERPDGR